MARKSLLLGTIASGVLLALAPALPAAAQPTPNAQPEGGLVVAGAGAISQGPQTTTVTQTSQRAVVHWQSFNVGSQQMVQVIQPSSSAVTLMRVPGPGPSEIAGRIESNGIVMLVNPAGTVIYQGGRLNDAGLVLSAAGVSTENFMADKMIFNQPPSPDGQISMHGAVTVKQAGLVGLLAPSVTVAGTVGARLGRVALVGAYAATFDLYGDGLTPVTITGPVTHRPPGVSALVTVTGQVRAPAGSVLLSSAAAGGVIGYGDAVQAPGSLSAPTIAGRPGRITVRADGAAMLATGSLSADGGPGSSGGGIVVDGNGPIVIGRSATLEATGKTGGGVIAVGTTLTAATAKSCAAPVIAPQANVASGGQIDADSTGDGPGGTIAVIARQSENFAGAAAATGGPGGGNGGYIEFGAASFTYSGTADVSAPAGQPGIVSFGC